MSNEAEKKFEAFLNLNTNNIENVIHDLWLAKDRSEWAKEPYFFVKLGDIAYKLGQSMFAHDILQEGLAHFPGHLRITQLYALSLIKCGFLGKARELLTRLVVKGQQVRKVCPQMLYARFRSAEGCLVKTLIRGNLYLNGRSRCCSYT